MFRTLTRVCVLVAMGAVAASAHGQGGDNCLSPQPVIGSASGSIVVNVDTNPATLSGNHASCDMISGATWYNSVDVWYLYTAAITGNLELHLSGCSSTITSSTASNLSLWNACGDATSVSCSRTACNSSLSFPITAGNSYLLRAATFAISSSGTSVARKGTASLTFTESGPPANDACSGAIQQTGPGTVSWNDALALPDGPMPACTSEATQKDLWYRYTPFVAGTVVVNSTLTTLWISIHDDACPPTTTFACGQGSVFFQAAAGTSYRVRIARPAGAATGISNLTFTEYAAPVNETCESAAIAVLGDNTWNDSGAVANAPYSTCGQASSATQRDVWFSYTAGVNGSATIRTRRTAVSDANGSNTDTTIAVFAGDCAGPQVVCASNTSTRRWACFPVVSGTTYLIKLSRAGTATRESMTMNLVDYDSSNIVGDSCDNPRVITSLGVTQCNNAGVCDDDPLESDNINCYGGGTGGMATQWVSYTPDQNGVAVFRTAGINTVLSAYAACSGNPYECSDKIARDTQTGLQSSNLAVPAFAGVPIIVRIDMKVPSAPNGFYQTVNLNVDLAPPAANDDCAGALPLQVGLNTFNNLNALDTPGVPNPSCNVGVSLGLTRHDLWYSWKPSQTGVTSVSTCWTGGPLQSAYVTVLTIYRDCTLSQEVACNDDYPDFWPEPCTDNESALTFVAFRHTTYLVRVASHQEYVGPGHLNVGFTPDACQADFDRIGGVQVADIFAFLSAWFASAPAANFDGVGGVTVADIFAYLSAWFAGC